MPQIAERAPWLSLRLSPGVFAVVLMWLIKWTASLVFADGALIAIAGWFGVGLLIFVWWMFFSRAPWLERLGAIVVMVVGVIVVWRIVDKSVGTGMMGMMKHAWPGGAIVQPNMTTDGNVLINSMNATGGSGTRARGGTWSRRMDR